MTLSDQATTSNANCLMDAPSQSRSSPISGRLWRALPLRRFRKDQKGATAVEFGLIALPFFGLLFAILESGLLFFAGLMLETAVQDSSRLVRTGQAQQASYSINDFKSEICSRVVVLPSCTSKLQVDVRTSATFDSIDLSQPVVNGKLVTDQFGYTAGHGGDIVVVRAFYEWPTFFKMLGMDYSNLSDGNHLLSATAAFKNEPFPW
jgi:Flp pilus assembly protein TadG